LLSRANPALESERAARLTFWINAYNALTIRGILLELSELESRAANARRGFDRFADLALLVGNREYLLEEIEQQELRPLKEPRIHFAIVCGARGCPRLRNEAYRTSDLDRQLEENSREFFADPHKVQFDPGSGRLRLSPILNWYAADFGDSPDELLRNIGPLLPAEILQKLKPGMRPEFLDYDRSLNAQAPLPPAPPVGTSQTLPPENKDSIHD